LYSNSLHNYSRAIDGSLYSEELLGIATCYLPTYIKMIVPVLKCIMPAKAKQVA